MGGPILKKTKEFLAIMLVATLVWEGLAVAGYLGPHATISEALWDIQRSWPVLTFGLGLFCGHFVWQRTP